MRPDLVERLLGLGDGERQLLQDLYQVRFADREMLARLSRLTRGAPEALRAASLLREAERDGAGVYWLSQSGQRAAQVLLPGSAQAGSRAYAVLRLAHEIWRGRLYVALRERGMTPEAYRAEPRLPYRSAAGLGARTLIPDAMVEGSRGQALLEVDRGTEAETALRHKWLRYREWQLEADAPRHLFVLALQPERLRKSLAAAAISAHVGENGDELADLIWQEVR